MPFSFGRTVHPLDFHRLDGHDFERLVFAMLLRMFPWKSLDWFGQTGNDGGRDIVGERVDDLGNTETVLVACANWKNFSATKATSDISNACASMSEVPDAVIIVVGNAVSSTQKETIRKHATSKDIHDLQVWSGAELEEHLRFHASSVLKRFYEGEVLPDETPQLTEFARDTPALEEPEAAALLSCVMDRPAFLTPIYMESSLPAFRRAVSDTIGAINTGIWRDRAKSLIMRVPSKRDLPPRVQDGLNVTVDKLNDLRMKFDAGLRSKRIRLLGQNEVSGGFYIEDSLAGEMEFLRQAAIDAFSGVLVELGLPPERIPVEVATPG